MVIYFTVKTKLFFIKLFHTIIWLFFLSVITYIFYAEIFNQIDYLFVIAVGLILVEFIILLLNNWQCPLTKIALTFVENPKVNFDIFLPEWLAKNNKTVFIIIIIIEIFYFIISI